MKREKKKKKDRLHWRLQLLPGPLLNSLSCPHSCCLFWNVFHMVLIHRYSVTESRLVSSTVNKIRMPTLTLIHSEDTWVGEYSLLLHFPRDCFPLTPLPVLYFYLWAAHASCRSSPCLQNSLPSTKHLLLVLQIPLRMQRLPLLPSVSHSFQPFLSTPSTAFGCCAMRMLSPSTLLPPLYNPPPPTTLPQPAPAVNHSDWAPPTCW